jgi:hypothetical protein
MSEEAEMPLTSKGRKIKRAMRRQYGKEKGERVFHASRNKGTIRGVDRRRKR